MPTQIRLRRDTTANWTSVNPVMALGEAGVDTDRHTIRLGDGVTAFLSLPESVMANQKGAPSGVATLDATGHVPASQMLTADVIAPPPTGVAATDTANLVAAIAATPAGGLLMLSATSAPYVINAALAITQSIAIDGRAIQPTHASSFDAPDIPYALGGVIKQTAAATNIFNITAGKSPRLSRLALTFDASIAGNTGHGIYCASGTSSGLLGFTMNDILVAGHDGNHYALYMNNPMHGLISHFKSYGGGGIFIGCNSPSANYGNLTIIAPTVMLINSGTAAGYGHSALTSGGANGQLNLITYIRPQCNVGVTGTQATWDDTLGAGVPNSITVISPDLENGPGKAQVLKQGAGTVFLGAIQQNRGDTNNTMYGRAAIPNPSGGSNSAFGVQALTANTSGGSNVAVGYQAMLANTNGTSNVAVGAGALATAINSYNTAIGQAAMNASTGWKGTAVGYQAKANAAGNDEIVAVGYQATSAGQSVAVGSSAVASGLYSMALGRGASASASGAAAIGVDSGGAAAASSTSNEIGLGTANHTTRIAGYLRIDRGQTTVGAAGGASALPATPTKYLSIKDSAGTEYVVPAYAKV